MRGRVFGVAAIAWALALPFATWIASRPSTSEPSSTFALVIYGIGSFVCHQLPERSFRLWAMQMPVCARCAGIYLGGALAVMVAAVVRHRPRPGPDPVPSPLSVGRAELIAAAMPTLITLGLEWTTGRMPAGWVRALAGAPLGAAVAWLVVRGGGHER